MQHNSNFRNKHIFFKQWFVQTVLDDFGSLKIIFYLNYVYLSKKKEDGYIIAASEENILS